MTTPAPTVAGLRAAIRATELQLEILKAELADIEAREAVGEAHKSLDELQLRGQEDGQLTKREWPLTSEEYKRYGRQMIVPRVGLQGQIRLKSASVLLVGAGGLGCPAAAYLAGAGVGTIGIVDGDVVETSNLHRQILHSTSTVGMKKVDSLISSLKSLNPNLTYNAHAEHLTPRNAQEIVQQYDLVLDCTDTPSSRYLISDICVLLSKALVSASALRSDGQLTVLNCPPLPAGSRAGGPCYRCVFPKAPPADSVTSCSDGGIIGPVVGVMGVLQALEALRLITAGKLNLAAEDEVGKGSDASMLLFAGFGNPPFRSVRLRSRRQACFACSEDAGLTLESLGSGSLDYVLFCGTTSPVDILKEDERIAAKEYQAIMKDKRHLLLDVREKVQFDICNLEGSINVPFSTFQRSAGRSQAKLAWLPESLPSDAPIYVVCRLGNDSQIVTRQLKESGLEKGGRNIRDIKGGLRSWKEQVDSSWPEY